MANFFDKIVGKFKSSSEGDTEQNTIIEEEKIINSIVGAIKNSAIKDNNDGICIWVRDNDIEDFVVAEGFVNNLRTALDNELLTSIGSGKIIIKKGKLADTEKPIIVSAGKIEISSLKVEVANKKNIKAEISIILGSGSTERPSYIIGPSDKTYYIGRGNICRKDGLYRVNDIVILENDPNENIQKDNNCVSSAHCDIVIIDGVYYLRVTKYGCRTEGGSATKIIRDQVPIEIRDVQILFPLKDGDIIELGKKVMLQYKEIPETI